MFVLRLTDAPLYKNTCSLSSAKIVQGECKDASLLAIIAEPQPIFCKYNVLFVNSPPFAIL